MARYLVNMNTLDEMLQHELEKVESAKAFGVSLWRQKKDESGANWNAYVKHIGRDAPADTKWWDIVPKLRATFSLEDEDE